MSALGIITHIRFFFLLEIKWTQLYMFLWASNEKKNYFIDDYDLSVKILFESNFPYIQFLWRKQNIIYLSTVPLFSTFSCTLFILLIHLIHLLYKYIYIYDAKCIIIEILMRISKKSYTTYILFPLASIKSFCCRYT